MDGATAEGFVSFAVCWPFSATGVVRAVELTLGRLSTATSSGSAASENAG
jgi:hypothetical protein